MPHLRTARSRETHADEQKHLARPALEHCLERSQELEAVVVEVFQDDGQYAQWDDTTRTTFSCLAAELALEHWSAVRVLLAACHHRQVPCTHVTLTRAL